MAPRIDTLQAAVRKAGFDTRRSDLWRYMREKRGWFTQMRDEGATWPAIGAAVRELGIKDRDGKLPTDETVRQTWKKIEKEPKPRVRKLPKARPALPGEEGEILPPPPQDQGAYNVNLIRRLAQKTIEAEPEPQKRKFRRGATFRGTEE